MSTPRALALVVDDSPHVRRLVTVLLAQLGVEALSVDDAREIAALARRYRPAVVVLDLVLPTTDGVTAIAQLRQAPETVGLPVVLITGYLERLGLVRTQIGGRGPRTGRSTGSCRCSAACSDSRTSNTS